MATPTKASPVQNVLIVLIGIAMVYFMFFRKSDIEIVKDMQRAEQGGYSAEYRISGSAKRVSITMSNAQGGSEQLAKVAVPWQKSLTVPKGTSLYISAQNDTEYGTVTCEIYVEGKQLKQSSSSGAFTIAQCSDYF